MEQGAIDASAELSEQEKAELIFLPNLSTKEDVSDLSGRGVGMDVVKKNIEEELSGRLTLETQIGKGSKFTIVLPL